MKKPGIIAMALCLMMPAAPVMAQDNNIHEPFIKGYSDGTVRPQENITREEAAVIMRRLVGDSIPATKMLVAYKDLPQDRWSYNAVNILVNQRIMKGYKDGTFKPESYITRAEAAAIFSRVYREEIPESEGKSDYKGHWAASNIDYGIEKKFIKGYEDGSFKPDQYVTRAEFIKMANSVFNRCKKIEAEIDEKTLPKDINEKDWYYEEVVEAVLPHKFENKDNINIYTETVEAEK